MDRYTWPRTLEGVESILALTRGSEYIAAVAELARLEPPTWLPRLASLLVAGQREDDLILLLEELQADLGRLEFLGLLTQELVLRTPVVDPLILGGQEFCGSPFDPFARRLRGCGHALGLLPPYRLPVEAEISLHRYYLPPVPFIRLYVSEAGAGPPGLMSHEVVPQPDINRREPGVAVLAARETTTERDAALMALPVLAWRDHGGGQTEARTFRLERPLVLQDVTVAQLEPLRLACLYNARPGTVELRRITPTEAFAVVFGSATRGGATGGALYGAYARLAAWRAVGGLLGATSHDPAGEAPGLAEEMVRAAWYSLDARSVWFDKQGPEIGLVCLRPDRRTIAVLAATDPY